MIKKLFIISITSLSLLVSPYGKIINPNSTAIAEAKTYVYYVPNSGYAYHAGKSCRTLSRSKTIKKTTVKKAKKLGLKPCGICYR